jgi:hypothetical protein
VPATPIFGLRYPSAADAANVPLDLQELAEDVEAALGSASSRPRVTVLPGAPVDGEEVDYVVDATNKVVWHLRYNAAGGTYKWEFRGGPPLYAFVTANEQRAATTYGALTTAGPSVTVPRPGEYDIELGNTGFVTSTDSGHHSYDVGGTGAVDGDATRTPPQDASVMVRRRKTITAASTALVSKYKSAAATYFGSRWIAVTPRAIS